MNAALKTLTTTILASLALCGAALANEPADVSGVLERDGLHTKSTVYVLNREQLGLLRGLWGQRLRLVGETLPGARLRNGTTQLRLLVRSIHLQPATPPAPAEDGPPSGTPEHEASAPMPPSRVGPALDGISQRLTRWTAADFVSTVDTVLKVGVTEDVFDVLKKIYDGLGDQKVAAQDALIARGGEHRSLYSALEYGGYEAWKGLTTKTVDPTVAARIDAAIAEGGDAVYDPPSHGSRIQLLGVDGASVANKFWKEIKRLDKEIREAAWQVFVSVYAYMEGQTTDGKAWGKAGLSKAEFEWVRDTLDAYRNGSAGDLVVYTRVYNWLVAGGPEGSSYRSSYQLLSQVIRATGARSFTNYADLNGAHE
ncbi:MAG: hypothetical protein AB7N76_01025 [Planctomycetota bacterium]